MAIIDVRQIRGRTGGEDDEGVRTWTEVWQLLSDVSNEQTYNVLAHPDLPERGDEHPEDDEATVRSRKPAQDGANPYLWTVSIEYSSKLTDDTKPATIEWGTKRSQVAWTIDEATGEAVKNSAGEPFKDLSTEEIIITLKMKRVEESYDPVFALGFIDCVNRDDFMGFEAGKVRCVNFTGTTMDSQLTSKYQVNYEFEIKLGGWIVNLLDQGSYEVVPTGSPVRRPFTERGTSKQKLELLNGSGRKLWDGVALPQPSPVFLPFTKYPPANFNRLHLP